MATIKKGILGGFSGKVGTVIGGNWKGVDYMRSLPKASSKAPTALQSDQRIKFAAVMAFLKPISALISKGYQAATGARTPMNAAVSYHVKNAIMGASPDFEVDTTKVIFSQGDLAGPWATIVESTLPASILFSWQDNTGTGLAEANDKAILLVYNATKSQYVSLENAANRSEGEVNLILPATFTGDEVDCWMSFSNEDGKRIATSVYIGKTTVS
ncbi:DUF6266 family protein [Pedobacter arcticus]|uniref:DUF6266 family protein n=1 Tax=Pedobacter arcticus TaxID=752140 RepID=UPI0002D87CAF|nr:DUF6266 family protein [Pedobacter arcticus]